jgi:hypothetical protein
LSCQPNRCGGAGSASNDPATRGTLRGGLNLLGLVAVEQLDRTCVAVDPNELTAADPPGGDGRAEHGGNPIFARHDRAVAERTSNVGDYAGGHGEQRGPGRGGNAGHQYVAGPHLPEVLRSAKDTGRSRDGSHASRNALDQVASLLLRCRRQPPAPHLVQAALRQQLRRCCPALAAPLLFALLDLIHEVAGHLIDFAAV